MQPTKISTTGKNASFRVSNGFDGMPWHDAQQLRITREFVSYWYLIFCLQSPSRLPQVKYMKAYIIVFILIYVYVAPVRIHPDSGPVPPLWHTSSAFGMAGGDKPKKNGVRSYQSYPPQTFGVRMATTYSYAQSFT